ncbi:MAG: hypothetical protein IGS38_16520 [Synechococcales cyanobacterium M58_A2018_015]|nr:hypothetical protein [Synechococcales cyanobacterium M58_A2018_015]
MTRFVFWQWRTTSVDHNTGLIESSGRRSNKSLEPTTERLSVGTKGYLRRLNLVVQSHSLAT